MIGPGCQIRENVTMNTGTVGGGGITRVGARCFFMVSSHVAHDCDVGDDVTFANNAVIGGHASIGNNVFLGGNCAVHQFCRIGEGVMLSGLSGAGDGHRSVRLCLWYAAREADWPQCRRPAPAWRVAVRSATAAACLSRAVPRARRVRRPDRVRGDGICRRSICAKGDRLHPRRRQAFADAPSNREHSTRRRSRWSLIRPARILNPRQAADRSLFSAAAAVFQAPSPRRSSNAVGGR